MKSKWLNIKSKNIIKKLIELIKEYDDSIELLEKQLEDAINSYKNEIKEL